jgi:PTH1 family peptidyl-tRNA hydrolase
VFRRKREAGQMPEWLIVGLGNPGPEYAHTRHNVGFRVVESLAKKHGIRLRQSLHRALTGSGRIDGLSVCLAKPLTFMNLSGQSVGALSRHFGLPPSRILVVADDIDLPAGVVRIRQRGSSGGHNGHKSIIAALKTEEYPRIKIGIGCEDRGEAAHHVLSSFERQEARLMEEAMSSAADACERVLRDGIERAMNVVNSRSKPGQERSGE